MPNSQTQSCREQSEPPDIRRVEAEAKGQGEVTLSAQQSAGWQPCKGSLNPAGQNWCTAGSSCHSQRAWPRPLQGLELGLHPPLATFPVSALPTTTPGSLFHLEMTQGYPRSLRTRPLPAKVNTPGSFHPAPLPSPPHPRENTASQQGQAISDH